MGELILVRHGETPWTARGIVTGSADVPLSPTGERQAVAAARTIAAAGLVVGTAHTSTLRRATRTAQLILDTLGLPAVTARRTGSLDERHLGALQGLDRAAAVARWGKDRRRAWLHDPDAVPPPGPSPAPGADRSPESVTDLTVRVLHHWRTGPGAELDAGATVLVVAHTGPLRVILRHLHGDAPDDEPDLACAVPLVLGIEPGRGRAGSRRTGPAARLR